MKNVFYNWAFSALFLASFFIYTTNVNAQSPPTVTEVMKICGLDLGGDGAPGPCGFFSYPANIDELCEGEITPFIYMVNLGEELYGTTKGLYNLPSGLPEIWVRHEYSPGNWILSGPYNGAEYIGEELLADGTYGDLYGIPLTLEVEAINSPCGAPLYLDYYRASRKVEVVTPSAEDPSGYKLYDIHLYSQVGDIWSCNAFFDTWCDCDGREATPTSPPISCDSISTVPSYDLAVCFECNGCVKVGNISEREGDIEEFAQHDEIELQVSPNPFDQEMNLSLWIPQDGDVTYTLYDARGKVVLQQTVFLEKGLHNSSFTTSTLPAGIYYFHYRQGTQKGTQKVLKY